MPSIPGYRPPLKNGKPDPLWLIFILIVSTPMMSFIIWTFARNGWIVFMGAIIWVILILNAKYDY